MIQKYRNHLQKKTNLSDQETWWLLQHITKKSQAELLLIDQLTKQEILDLEDAIIQIKTNHKPLAYIIGFVPFLDLKIKVKAPILIPRVETEEWVHKIIQDFAPHQDQIKNICDMGTGSGCIALALAKHFPNAHITAVDINDQALSLAQQNAILNNIKNITFVHSNLFSQLLSNIQFDLIVSNPPYIDFKHHATMKPQVTKWEDAQALFAQDQGLAIITTILQNSLKFLKKNNALSAQLILEIDHDQHEQVITIAESLGWNAQAVPDSFLKWRTIWCKIK